MTIYEYTTAAPLVNLIGKIQLHEEKWGAVVVKRHYLQAITNEAFRMAVTPVLQGVEEAHIAFLGDQNIYILWRGKQKTIYKMLHNFLSASLMRPGFTVRSEVLATYIDPIGGNDELLKLIDAEKSGKKLEKPEIEDDESEEADEDDSDFSSQSLAALRISPEQVQLFLESKNQKPYRRQLQLLVVEDQLFAQKILCEILRGVRVHNNNESPEIEVVQTLQSAWKVFLKKAPDITLIDLNLPDGSGHMLARAIKEIDPVSQVIIITANHHEDEVKVARQNNVDGFVTKPYNKKQILDIIDRYVDSKSPKGIRRGTTGQF